MGSFTRKRVGDILVEAGAITDEQLQELMTEQIASQKRLNQLLVEKELLTEEKLLDILEEQLGIEQINLYNYNINPEVSTLIPLYLAKRHLVIPIEQEEKKLKLAMADPMNIIAIDDVAMITGLEVIPVIASESAINHAIEQIFSLAESLDQETTLARDRDEDEIAKIRALVEEAPIVKVVNSLIHQAVNEGASDIHIEPSGKGVRVRMRIDGMLHDMMTPPKETQPLIVSRIKIMSNLDIAERRLPQDGRITIQVGLKDINMRVSTMPTIHGEKVVIRILDKEKVVMTLDKLGFSERNYKLFTNFLLNHTGMILVTGPTGSGKTTTLYSALNYLNKAEDNIITVEDPVEYRLDGINQVQVNARINLTFANALRTILRQDPNVIMIGEIRDLETAEMATRAALTGHLVLSTLHTNDACSTITRLQDMGVDSFLITSSLVGVVSQRLVRLICNHCREQYRLSSQEQILFRNTFWQEAPEKLFRGKGCRNCNDTGYRGRIAIHELLPLNKELHRLILERASADVLQEKALEQGMVTLLQDGLRRINKGDTTIEEVVRVAYSSSVEEVSKPLARPAAAVDIAAAPVEKVAETAVPVAQTARPVIRVECTGPEMACAGETVALSYTVTNPGSVPLENAVVTDPLLGREWRHFVGTLEPGQTVDFKADYTVADSETGFVESAPAATAQHGSDSVEAGSSHTIKIARPALKIEKSGPPAAQVGETVDYQFIVVNTGNVPLSEVVVTDPLIAENWTYTIGELPPEGMSSFNIEAVVPEGLSGRIEEKVEVKGRYGDREVTAGNSYSIEVNSLSKPGVTIEIDGPKTARVGETITYRFAITNSGTVALSGVKVTAPLFGRFWCNTIGSLGVSKSVKFSFNYKIPEGITGELVNKAAVSGWSGESEVAGQAEHKMRILARQVL